MSLLKQFEKFEEEHQQTIDVYEKYTGLTIKPLAKIDGDVVIQFAEFYYQEKVKKLNLARVSQQRELLELVAEIANSTQVYSNTRHKLWAKKLISSNCG
jgi:hypothetical protein